MAYIVAVAADLIGVVQDEDGGGLGAGPLEVLDHLPTTQTKEQLKRMLKTLRMTEIGKLRKFITKENQNGTQKKGKYKTMGGNEI